MSILPLSDISNTKSIHAAIVEKDDQINVSNPCKENMNDNIEIESVLSEVDSKSLSKEKTNSKLLTSNAIQSKVSDFEKITRDLKLKHNPLNRSTTDSSLLRKGSYNRGLVINTKAIDIAKLQGAAPTQLLRTKFPMDVICQGRLNEMKRKTAPVADIILEENDGSKLILEQYPTIRSKSAGRMEPKRKSLLIELKTNSLDRSRNSHCTRTKNDETKTLNYKKTIGNKSMHITPVNIEPHLPEKINMPTSVKDYDSEVNIVQNDISSVILSSPEIEKPFQISSKKSTIISSTEINLAPHDTALLINHKDIFDSVPIFPSTEDQEQSFLKLDIEVSCTSPVTNCNISTCSLEAPIFSKVMKCKSTPLVREIIINKMDLLPYLPPTKNFNASQKDPVKEKDSALTPLQKGDTFVSDEDTRLIPHSCVQDLKLKEQSNRGSENVCSFVDHILESVLDISKIYPSILERKAELASNCFSIEYNLNSHENVNETHSLSNDSLSACKLLEVSLPEPIKPISFIVEEVINFIDDSPIECFIQSSMLMTEPSKKDNDDVSLISTSYSNGSSVTLVDDLTPTPSPLPINKSEVILSHSRNLNTSPSSITEVINVSSQYESRMKTTLVFEGFTPRPELNRKSPIKEEKKDFSEVGLTRNNMKCESSNAVVRLSYSSKSEEDGSVSSCDRPTDADGMMASASASSSGSPLSWGSSQGPVARRDLLPLDEDYEKTPSWQALLAVNRPDSDDDLAGYESDDDFEDVDIEMQRLEEKLKQFELELANSSSEDYTSKEKNDSSKLVSKLRLKQEDIDILKTFSLPEVYPAVDINKTKHLSLILGNESELYAQLENDSSENSSTESSMDLQNLSYVKRIMKLKKSGQRKCLSLPYIRHIQNKRTDILSNEELNISIQSEVTAALENEAVACSDDSDKISSATETANYQNNLYESAENISRVLSEPEEPLPLFKDAVKCDAEVHPRVPVPDDFVYSKQLYTGITWIDPDSDITSFDFDGLEEMSENDIKNSLLFIFEDDDDLEDSVDYHSCKGVPCGSDLSLYHSTDSKIPQQSEIISQVQSDHDYSKKKSGNLLSSFKSGFQKAAKYLGPINFTKNNKDEERVYLCNEEKQFLELQTSFLLNQKEIQPTVIGDPCAYHVPSATRVHKYTPSTTSQERGHYSSGEFYASPAVCVLTTSDEDQTLNSEKINYLHENNELSIKQDDVNPHNPQVSVSCEDQRLSEEVNNLNFVAQFSSNITPPIPPPRTSSKEGNVVFSSGDNFETVKTLFEITNAANTNVNNEASTPSKDAFESPTHNISLRQLKRKQRERIKVQNSEEMLETSGCNFCMGVPMQRGRSDIAGNHNRQSSPHPKVLPARRTWPPRI